MGIIWMMTDEEAVILVQRGNKNNFGEIVDRYEGKIYGYLKRLTNQKDEEVEDLTQETFISCYQNILGFNPEKKFSSWIYRIAHNKAVDYFKKKRLKTETMEGREEYLESQEKLIEELEIEKEEKESVAQALGKLELKYREVVMLYYFEDRSYEEISDILRTSTNNVGVMLLRAKEKLKINLQSNNYELREEN